MSTLYDGITKIHTIHILGIYRNNENYLTFLFKRFCEWEAYYTDVSFRYYFLENDSIDKTREKLQAFIKDRPKSKLILYHLKKDYRNVNDGTNYERISTLAKLRNLLVDTITPLPENEWALFIDSNIYFQDDILSVSFSQTQPTENNIGMMGVYTQQLFIPKLHSTSITKPVLIDHYYDTYSVVDLDNKSFFPRCPFQKCKKCRTLTDEHNLIAPSIKENQAVVEVKACFGGFVFIHTNILNIHNVRWDTLMYNMKEDKSTCEHVLFCDRLRSITNKKIVVLQDVDKIYRTV